MRADERLLNPFHRLSTPQPHATTNTTTTVRLRKHIKDSEFKELIVGGLTGTYMKVKNGYYLYFHLLAILPSLKIADLRFRVDPETWVEAMDAAGKINKMVKARQFCNDTTFAFLSALELADIWTEGAVDSPSKGTWRIFIAFDDQDTNVRKELMVDFASMHVFQE